MLNLSYEYKLKPTDEQISEIKRTLIICRKVWNYALRERKDWINSRKCPINACSIVSEYVISASLPECGYTTHRDVAAAQVIRNRGLSAQGRSVDIKEIACGGGLTGTGNSLVKSLRDRKKKA